MALVCPACGAVLRRSRHAWHLVCASCSYEGSDLVPSILDQKPGGELNELARASGLEPLRRENFRRLHARLLRWRSSTGGQRLSLLDVGCAHGWFLEQVRVDFDPLGLEPDPFIATQTRARGLAVRQGFFPDVLDETERFDVICFNDVLEHIPDVVLTLRHCLNHLRDGGLVVVNAPARTGALYRTAKFLDRLSLSGSFKRMWQVGFPSPHVHYFDRASITRVAARAGFTVIDSITLPSIRVSGLYARIRSDRELARWKALLLAAGIATAYPLLRILPPDIEVWFLAKRTGWTEGDQVGYQGAEHDRRSSTQVSVF